MLMRLALIIRPSRILMQSDRQLYSTHALKRASPESTDSSSKLARFDSAPSRRRPQMSHPSRFGLKSTAPLQTTSRKARGRAKQKQNSVLPILSGPLHDEDYINQNIPHPGITVKDPKYIINNARLTTRFTDAIGRIHDPSGSMIIHR